MSTRDVIRRIFMKNGFTVKEGETDLKEYVFKAAEELLETHNVQLNPNPMAPIPISAGQRIAKEFGYDQVVIIARRVGEGEHVTTYGRTKEHCSVAAKMGDFFKYKLMGWTP